MNSKRHKTALAAQNTGEATAVEDESVITPSVSAVPVSEETLDPWEMEVSALPKDIENRLDSIEVTLSKLQKRCESGTGADGEISPLAEARLQVLEETVRTWTERIESVMGELNKFKLKALLSGDALPMSGDSVIKNLQLHVLDALDETRQKEGYKDRCLRLEKVFNMLASGLMEWGEFSEAALKLSERGVIRLGEGGRGKKINVHGKRYGRIRRIGTR